MARTCNCHGGPNCCAGLSHESFEESRELSKPLHDPLFAPEETDKKLEPLSEKTLLALAEIGIGVEDWEPHIVSEDDAEHVLAFHKFLTAGSWSQTEEGEPIYMIDQAGFDYAIGKIDSKTYLEAEEGEKNAHQP